jgi:uncharacterized ion transporter superfamily protein YfcC
MDQKAGAQISTRAFIQSLLILLLLLIGSSFAVLDKSGLMQAALARIVKAYTGRKYQLLWMISLFFMTMGAFFGIFEEVVPLVPLMLALSYYLGWDALVGLGMSILTVNMGFSAAITNPFTIGVAQKIAGLPLFSGAWFRIFIFIAIYLVYMRFLSSYARKIEKQPQASPVYLEDQVERAKYASLEITAHTPAASSKMRRAMIWLAVCLLLILLILVLGPLAPAISTISLPLVGLLFFLTIREFVSLFVDGNLVVTSALIASA